MYYIMYLWLNCLALIERINSIKIFFQLSLNQPMKYEHYELMFYYYKCHIELIVCTAYIVFFCYIIIAERLSARLMIAH